jgi:predicted nucleic acid-binding protein
MIGPVRQELLSGIADENIFNELKSKLALFEDFPLVTADYETAASFFNTCRRKGVQGSHVDFLICAAAFNNNFFIFTNDQDFFCYALHLPIKLFNSFTPQD